MRSIYLFLVLRTNANFLIDYDFQPFFDEFRFKEELRIMDNLNYQPKGSKYSCDITDGPFCFNFENLNRREAIEHLDNTERKNTKI